MKIFSIALIMLGLTGLAVLFVCSVPSPRLWNAWNINYFLWLLAAGFVFIVGTSLYRRK